MTRGRLPQLAVTLAVLAPVLVYVSVYFHYRLRAPQVLDAAGQDLAIQYLHAAVDQRPEPALGNALRVKLNGPIWVTLYRAGEILIRHEANDPDLAGALRSAAQAIRASEAVRKARGDVRIKVDICLGRGPIVTGIPIVFAHSVVAGLDGIGIESAGRTAYLLPDDIFQKDLLGGTAPFSFMVEFRSGLDTRATVELLADRLGLTADEWRRNSRRYFRFRTQSLVESLDHRRALPVLRSRVPIYRVDRRMVREAVVRSADYVLRQIRPDGSFEYIYYPTADRHSVGEYSLPRHAGTTWFLSLAFRVLGAERYREGARRAIDYLGIHAVPRGCQGKQYACVGTDTEGDLGSAALGIVAITEYQRATGDRRFEGLARKLGEFLLWMQKPNGDFCHQFKPGTGERNCQEILLYYSGEASLALAKLFQLTRDERYRRPLERALDFLTGENYDFFLGQFFIGEDHWTCIAAEAAFEAVNKDQYARFCYEFARLNARAQVQPGEGLMDDLQGAFSVTPFFMPHNTPAGSRTESNVATYLLSVRRGEPQADVLRSVRLSLRLLLDQQLRPEGGYLFPNAAAASGGMMQTAVRPNIRIDFVQHAAAAMARGLELVPEEGWTP